MKINFEAQIIMEDASSIEDVLKNLYTGKYRVIDYYEPFSGGRWVLIVKKVKGEDGQLAST